jgi:polysaccharide biosynthesis/export protein
MDSSLKPSCCHSLNGLAYCMLGLAVFLASSVLVSSVAVAQQPASPSPSGSNAAPAADVPAQTPAQASVSASTGTTIQTAEKTADSNTIPIIKLGPGDLFEVNVYNVPELTSKVRVSNSGDVYLPLIDYVHVEGLTQEEAQTLIEKRLSDGGFVRNPHVTIFVDEATSQGVTVIGEVQRPGIYPDVADHKLYEIVSEAGGFTSAASRKISILHRTETQPQKLELPRNLADDMSGNVEIMPGDTITVPRAPIIYVVGDVGRPSGLLVDNGQLTVLQALALAGGTNHTAKLGGARIIRKGPNGMTETPVLIKKMLEAKIPDVPLQADDILFVPVSGAKVFAGRTFDVAMTAATAVSIYAVHP